MTLKEKINEDLKAAMKSGDKLRLESVRAIRAKILEFEKSGIGRDMSPDDEIKLLSSEVKKRKDSIEQYLAAGRNDIAEKEKSEMLIIQEYLPKQLTEDEIRNVIKSLASAVGAVSKADFSKLMPAAAKELKGKADGKIVRTLVEEFLGS
ncbi:MAG: GatB/YqeY domain-containing protein [Ignavibacteriales bacterium]|nr:MAG: GatB/YqeY domain-containing protein [Ignavibacteriales bacterium]